MTIDSSSSVLFPTRVRLEVFEQHKVLRKQLERALEATTQGLRLEDSAQTEVFISARELHRRFGVHLAFEERALVPILATEEVWGPERANALLQEHNRQRAELDTLIEGIELGWDLERLSLVLRSLVVDLLRDMSEEEEALMRDELLDQPVICQTPRRLDLRPPRGPES
jgi:hypothetical protein